MSKCQSSPPLATVDVGDSQPLGDATCIMVAWIRVDGVGIDAAPVS